MVDLCVCIAVSMSSLDAKVRSLEIHVIKFCEATTIGLQAGNLGNWWHVPINRWWKKMNIVALRPKKISVRHLRAVQFYSSGN